MRESEHPLSQRETFGQEWRAVCFAKAQFNALRSREDGASTFQEEQLVAGGGHGSNGCVAGKFGYNLDASAGSDPRSTGVEHGGGVG
jgi:hypothetical protein